MVFKANITMTKKISILLLLIMTFFFNACDKYDNKVYMPEYSKSLSLDHKKEYIFSIHPLHNTLHVFKTYQPLLDYLNEHLENEKLVIETSKKYATYDKKLADRKFDFSLGNPYQTVQSLKYGYHVFGKMGDDDIFRGLILTRKDSNINTINDLKGKKVCYPAPTAIAATMMPQWHLYKLGLDVNNDITSLFVGSQESSIMNVYLGKVVAGTTWIPSWKAFKKERPDIANQLVVTWKSDPLINNGLFAKDTVPKVLLEKVSNLIANLHTHKRGKLILSKMGISKYEKANDDTYNIVKRFIIDYKKHIRNKEVK